MLLSCFTSEILGLCDTYFKTHYPAKEFKNLLYCVVFPLIYTLFFISTSIAHYSGHNSYMHFTYIGLKHMFMCLSPLSGLNFSRVLAETWKLLNKYLVDEQIYIWLLFVSWSEQMKLLDQGVSIPTSFIHVFIQQMLIEPLLNAILRPENQW